MSHRESLSIDNPRNLARGMTYMIDCSASFAEDMAAWTEDPRWNEIGTDLDRLVGRMQELGGRRKTTRAERTRKMGAFQSTFGLASSHSELEKLLADPSAFANTLSRLMGHFATMAEPAAERTADPAWRAVVDEFDRFIVRLREIAANPSTPPVGRIGPVAPACVRLRDRMHRTAQA